MSNEKSKNLKVKETPAEFNKRKLNVAFKYPESCEWNYLAEDDYKIDSECAICGCDLNHIAAFSLRLRDYHHYEICEFCMRKRVDDIVWLPIKDRILEVSIQCEHSRGDDICSQCHKRYVSYSEYYVGDRLLQVNFKSMIMTIKVKRYAPVLSTCLDCIPEDRRLLICTYRSTYLDEMSPSICVICNNKTTSPEHVLKIVPKDIYFIDGPYCAECLKKLAFENKLNYHCVSTKLSNYTGD